MRVLFLSQEFPPKTDWGGIGTYAGIMTRALARQGVEVHVLSVAPDLEREDEVVEGVHLHTRPLRRPRGVGRALRLNQTWARVSLTAAVLYEQWRLEEKFDVCESPEWSAEGLALTIWRQPPLVVRLHSGAAQIFPYLQRRGWDSRLAVRCEEALIRRADMIMGPRAIMHPVAEKLGLAPDRLRPMLYPVERAKPASPPKEGPRILFAGRLEPRKGPDILLKAVPQVLDHHPDARFVLIGADAGGADGRSFRLTLEELIDDLGIGDAVEMPGRLGGPDTVAEELSRSVLCAMPSRWESMGYVAAEAAALGRPVVASRIPALAEIVEDGVTGRLVDVDDVNGWARAIIDLLSLSEEQRSRIGSAGARLISAKCDPDLIATKTLAVYEEAIQRRNGLS